MEIRQGEPATESRRRGSTAESRRRRTDHDVESTQGFDDDGVSAVTEHWRTGEREAAITGVQGPGRRLQGPESEGTHRELEILA